MPFLWFDDNAEEALDFYVSIFKDARILSKTNYPIGSPGEAGKLMTASIEIFGQQFNLLNGGPHFKFNPSISFFISCENQEEVDYYWNSLLEGGEESQCGWLSDKFGLSWQIVPKQLNDLLLNNPSPIKSQNVMGAMLKMKKLIIQDLQDAFNKE